MIITVPVLCNPVVNERLVVAYTAGHITVSVKLHVCMSQVAAIVQFRGGMHAQTHTPLYTYSLSITYIL